MLLTRFWTVLVGLALGAALFVLSLSHSMYNRSGRKAMGEGLSADSQVVSWYLKDDARMRAAHLLKFAIDPTIAKTLHQASLSENKLSSAHRETIEASLKKINAQIDEDQAFDSVFAVDRNGRVIGALGYGQAQETADFELGGYPVVADALHGYVRDDTLVWGRLYRVVARPVELEAGGAPAGAIVGARIIDEKFARELSARTGAAVAFYTGGQRTAAAAPEGFPKASLDQIVTDLEGLANDEDYRDKGRSGIREVGPDLAVQYTRLPGEAYTLGAGFAVGRVAGSIPSMFGFVDAADDKDKGNVPWSLIVVTSLVAIGVGLIFSILEHTVPVRKFNGEALRLASGQIDQLHPSRFRGLFRKIAAELNEGIDKVASSQGGVSRKAANLEQVLGDLPAQPVMAAFGLPDFGTPSSENGTAGGPPSPASPPGRALPKAPPRSGSAQGAATAAVVEVDPEAEWTGIFQQFVQTKVQCGESTEGFTYEKFRETLIKNREAIVVRHGVSAVKFTVYVKEGRAALKASPHR